MEGNCQKSHERLEDQGMTSHWDGKMKTGGQLEKVRKYREA